MKKMKKINKTYAARPRTLTRIAALIRILNLMSQRKRRQFPKT